MQTNENSLANLRLPKKKKDGHGYRYTIPQEKIDDLFCCLAEGMSLKKSAKETGVCFETARKYHREGDAKRGIKPLFQRLEIFQEKISMKLNVLLEEQRMERLAFTRSLIKKAQTAILDPQDFYDKSGNKLEVYDAEGNKVDKLDFKKVSIRDIERLMKLEAFLAGGVRVPVKESARLTADEISGVE